VVCGLCVCGVYGVCVVCVCVCGVYGVCVVCVCGVCVCVVCVCVCVNRVLGVCFRQVVAFLFGSPDRHNSSSITAGRTKPRLICLRRTYNRVIISTACQGA